MKTIRLTEPESRACPWCGRELRIDEPSRTSHHIAPACNGYLQFCQNGGARELGATVHVDGPKKN